MKAHSSPKKILIVLGVVILGLFVSIYFLFTDIKQKNEHTSQLSQNLASNVDKQASIIALRKAIASSDSDIAHVSESIIPVDGDVQFIENLERVARENNLSVTINSLTFENNPLLASSTVTTFKISGEVSGDWAGAYKFLAEIESLPIKIKVNKIKVSSDAEGVWGNVFEIVALKYK